MLGDLICKKAITFIIEIITKCHHCVFGGMESQLYNIQKNLYFVLGKCTDDN